jgi:HEAT repeat protein
VENRRSQVTEFVRGILDCPDDTEETLHRNLLLALAIAGDDVNLEPGLVSEMVGRAVACLSTSTETLVKGLVEPLGQLVANGAADVGLCFGNVGVSEDGRLRKATAEALGLFAEVPEICQWMLVQLAGEDFETSGAAIDALSSQVEADEEVRRAVLKKLDDDILCERAARCLVHHSWERSDVRSALLAKLSDPDAQIRMAIVQSLTERVSSDEAIQQILMARLDDSNEYVRCSAVNALSLVEAPHDAMVQAVKVKLEDSDSDVRETVVSALTIWGLAGEGLSQPLEMPVDDGEEREESTSVDWVVRKKFAERMIDAGPTELEEIARILINRGTLESMAPLPDIVSAAPDWLTEQGTWRDHWLGKLTSEFPEERAAALSGLSRLGLDDLQVRELALKALEDRHPCCRASALGELSHFVGMDGEARRMALDMLEDEDSRVQEAAVSALSGLVLTDTEVRQAILERVAVARDGDVRDSLFGALSSLVDSEPAVRSVFLAESENPYLGKAAFEVLSRLVKRDGEVQRLMFRRLRAESVYVKAHAVCALSEFMETEGSFWSLVLKCLESGSYVMRQAALAALSRVVEKDLEARRLVLGRIEDERCEVRQEAVRALANLVGRCPDATAALVGRLADEHFTVRLAAVHGLTGGAPESLHQSTLDQLLPWLSLDVGYNFEVRPRKICEVRAQMARFFSLQLRADSRLRDRLVGQLRDPRWSARLGAVLTFFAGPDTPAEGIREVIFQALCDRRGLEAFPAQLTAASFLLNRSNDAKALIEMCLEALDYGTQPWEYLPLGSIADRNRFVLGAPVGSGDVRRQAALVLSKLEPIAYDERAFSKLLHVLESDEDHDVRDAAYGALVRLARAREQVGASRLSAMASRE